MKTKFILSFLLLICMTTFSQNKEKSKFNIMSFDMGFTSNNYLNMNFNVVYNRVLYGFEYEMPLKSGEIGEYYSTINWDQFSEDRQSSGMFVDNLLCFQLGYNIIDKLVVGVGIGFGEEIYYRNMFDEFHILGNNGYYYLNKSGKVLLQTKVFVNYFIPLSEKYYLALNAQYTKLGGTGGGIGVGFKF